MQNLAMFPNYLMRQWTADGKVLSGGTLSFYQSNTFVPKAVYADAQGTISLGSTVTLDASGSAVIFLGQGAYRIWLKNSVGSQIVPYVDGIVGSTGGIDPQSTLTIAFVLNYDELRALSNPVDVVYVSGRTVEGDGGAGLFQYDPTATELDDDGIILVNTASARVYKRIFDAVIDPKWYGVKYGGSSSNSVALLKAVNASAALKLPVLLAGSTYIDQNITIPANATLSFSNGAFLTGPATQINVTFADDSRLICDGRSFGTNINPKIGNRVIDSFKLSYIAGNTADERMDKLLLASTSKDQIIEVDESVSILASTWIVVNKLILTNNAIITFTGASGLNWTSAYIVPEANRFFNVSSTASVAFNFGTNYIYPEMFGAVADGVTSDSIAFGLATFGTNILLSEGKTYRLNSNMTKSSSFNIKGGGILDLGSSTDLNAVTLTLTDVGIVKAEDFNPWFTGTNLFAVNSSFPSNYFVSGVKSINGCSYNDDDRYPVLDGTTGPAIYKAHLPLIVDSASLYTDINGKIQGRSWQVGKSWTVTNYVGNGQYYNALRYLNGNWIIIGNNGLIKTSTDMINWTVRNSGTTVFLSDVTWNGTYYVVCGDSSTYLRSSDLVTWTPSVSKPTTTGVPVFMATNGSRFVTTDRINGQIVSSADGLNWSSVYSFGGSSGSQCSYGNGAFLCGGNNGKLAYSTDGITFVAKSCPSSPQFYTSFYDTLYSRWIMFSAGTVAISTDQSTNNWVTYPTGQTETIYFALRVDDTIVAVGANGRIMTSPDGRYWTNRYSGTSAFMYGSAVNGHDLYATGAGELIIKADYI